MFSYYDKFVANGIPVEDARFILPYGLKTNIYMSLNARELVHVICTMIYGRGSRYEEIYKLGLMLKEQFDIRYPGLIENSKNLYTNELNNVLNISPKPVNDIKYVYHNVKLVSYPKNAANTINKFAQMTGYEKFDFNITTQFRFYFGKSIYRAIHRYLIRNSKSYSIIILRIIGTGLKKQLKDKMILLDI